MSQKSNRDSSRYRLQAWWVSKKMPHISMVGQVFCHILYITTSAVCYSSHKNVMDVVLWSTKETSKWHETMNTYLLTHSLLTPWCRIFFEKLTITQLFKWQAVFFMETKGSLPCSQKPLISMLIVFSSG
jgi:hypothetical protein